MRKLLAVVVLVAAGFVVTTDPFCCADGCTNGQQSAVAAPTCCSLCLSSVTVPSAPALTTVGTVQRVVSDLPLPHLSSPAARIDHPPRLA